jgi:hypothetical protein
MEEVEVEEEEEEEDGRAIDNDRNKRVDNNIILSCTSSVFYFLLQAEFFNGFFVAYKFYLETYN